MISSNPLRVPPHPQLGRRPSAGSSGPTGRPCSQSCSSFGAARACRRLRATAPSRATPLSPPRIRRFDPAESDRAGRASGFGQRPAGIPGNAARRKRLQRRGGGGPVPAAPVRGRRRRRRLRGLEGPAVGRRLVLDIIGYKVVRFWQPGSPSAAVTARQRHTLSLEATQRRAGPGRAGNLKRQKRRELRAGGQPPLHGQRPDSSPKHPSPPLAPDAPCSQSSRRGEALILEKIQNGALCEIYSEESFPLHSMTAVCPCRCMPTA
jgi:hypothetical protein